MTKPVTAPQCPVCLDAGVLASKDPKSEPEFCPAPNCEARTKLKRWMRDHRRVAAGQ